jgi:hypothetical protein
MRFFRFLSLVIAVVILSGCASGVQKLRKIDPGMSLVDVEAIMSRRDSFATAEHEGRQFILHKYTNHFATHTCRSTRSATSMSSFGMVQLSKQGSAAYARTRPVCSFSICSGETRRRGTL